MDNELIYGVAYYYEYLPCDRIDEDFRMMNEAGINTIRIAESTWSSWEPSDGVFDFTYLHIMLDAATRYGLKVIVGTPTYAIPSWLDRKHPDILAETHWGKNRYGARQNFDITNPHYLFHAERIIRKLMEEVKDYDCVIGFQLDNETKAYDTCSQYAQQGFFDKLREDFGSVRALNDEMGLNYWSNSVHSWDDLPDVRGTINASYGAEFEAYQRKLVTDFLMWQRQIVDEYRRPDQFVTHNFDYDWRLHAFSIHPDVNQFDAANALTVTGCDIYHPSEHLLTGVEIAFCGAVAYGLKKNNYLVLETEAQGNFGWLPYPKQLRLQAFMHLACGANGVSYWHWHSIHNAIESYWKGLLSHDFCAGEVYKEACTIGADFKRLSASLINLTKTNRVAVMVSNRSLNGLKWFPTSHQQDTSHKRTYGDYLRWLCDALYRMNVEYDIINDTERDFSSYDVLILPTLYSAPEDLCLAVKKYVSDGGHVIATFKSFFSDKYLKIYHDAQPHLLTDCFGITYDRFTKPVDVSLFSEIFDVESDSCAIDWMELLTIVSPDSASPLLEYVHDEWGGIPAAVLNNYGRGEAVYLGCCFDDCTTDRLLRYLLGRWEIAVPPYSFPFVIKQGINSFGKKITYYMNFSGKAHTITLSKGGRELLGDTVFPDGYNLTLEKWDVFIVERE